MKNIRVAVIGMGNMGTAHATCIANGEIDGMSGIAGHQSGNVEIIGPKFHFR